MAAVMGYDIGKDLCDALGLPKYTKAFSLSVRAGEAVTIECEYYPDINKGSLTALLAQFELVRKDVPAQPQLLHFDAWMRERTEQAHAAYMAHHAGGGRAYA